jgi:hypothetical protein
MRNKFVALSLLVVIMAVFVTPVFADKNLGSNGQYTVRYDGYDCYYIDDTNMQVCVATIRVEPAGTSGVYNFFCNGKTYSAVKGGASVLASGIAVALGAGYGSGVAGWLAGIIYDSVCSAFE